MSKINVSFDTITKSCEVTMNGAKVENIAEVMISKIGENKFILDLVTRVGDYTTDDGTVTVTKIMASDVEKTKTKYYSTDTIVESIEDDRDFRVKSAAFDLMRREDVLSSYYKN